MVHTFQRRARSFRRERLVSFGFKLSLADMDFAVVGRGYAQLRLLRSIN